MNQKRILIIEDDEMVRDGVIELLSSEGFDMLEAPDGSKGLIEAQKHLPDLIICDIMMPGLNGFQVLDALQQDQTTSTIPFIFLTAKSDRADYRYGMQLGADDFLTKPFKADELYQAVEARLNKQIKHESKSDEKLNTLKYNITTFIPHELRTPLNGILASSQLLIEYKDTMDDTEIDQLHENIYTSAKRLNHLIINYLYYSELAVLNIDPKKKDKVRDNPPTEDTEASIAELAKNIAKNYSREEDLYLSLNNCVVQMQEEQLQKVCEEVIDNAFKFSKKGSKVTIKSSKEDNKFKIEIVDYGRGMSADQIKQVSAFTQFDRNIHEQQGSGLGLAIAYSLLDLYNSTYKIESEVDKFTKVLLFIPLANQ